MRYVAILVILLLAAPAHAQLGKIGGSPYDPESLSNPYGAGSPYKLDGLMNPYSRYGSRYSNESWMNPYATKAPQIHGSDGAYLGRLSSNRYAPDSTSNSYGRYGSRYSPSSINNSYGPASWYRATVKPLYVYPGGNRKP